MGKHVAIAGATGAVGLEMISVLEQRQFPVDKLTLLASARSRGRELEYQGRKVPVEVLGPDSFRGVDIALFSAGADRSREFAPAAVEAGAVVVDNSSAFRMDPEVPLVVPEINPDQVARHRGIIANPNCSTIILVLPLAVLEAAAGLEWVVVSTYQAVSGAGLKAMTELREQTRAQLADEDYPPAVFPHPIAFNVIAHCDRFEENGYTKEEMKLVNESRKIMDLPDLRLAGTAVRVPVFRAHSEAVTVATRRPLSPEEARRLLAAAPGIEVVDDPAAARYPLPRQVAGRDDVQVGRIRANLAAPGLNFWVVGDQLRKGAALNAVQIAELLV